MAKKKREPAYKDGKAVCPECLTQDDVELLDYGLRNSLLWFKHYCNKCKVTFTEKIPPKDF